VGSEEEGGGGASVVGGDEIGDVVLIEAVAQASRALRARAWANTGVGERHGVAGSLH